MPPMYIPMPIPIPINGGGGGDIVVSGPWAIVILACIIILLIMIGIMSYDVFRDYWVMYKHERKMKKKIKERRKSE